MGSDRHRSHSATKKKEALSDMMDRERINALGDELYDALRSGRALAPLTDREGDIQVEDAYHISLRVLDRRVKDDGETIVGKKNWCDQ